MDAINHRAAILFILRITLICKLNADSTLEKRKVEEKYS